jgi:hypothetical protein
MSPSHHEVRTVIAQLGQLGFIDTGDAEAPELVPGVVAGAPERAPAGPGLELGAAGTAGGRGAPERGPAAPDLALGAPGASLPRITRPTPAPDLGLGAPGGRITRPTPSPDLPDDVSLDLSDHLSVRPDDVKEAVRASRVMSAVEIPEGLDMITDSPTAPASAFDAPTVMRPPETARLSELTRPPAPEIARPTPVPPEVARQAEPMPVRSSEIPSNDTIRVGKKPPSRQSPAMKPPVELPQAPIPQAPMGAQNSSQIEKTARVSPPPGPGRGVSPVLIVALFVALVGGGGFLAWKYVLDKPASDAETAAPAPQTPVKPPPPAPPPPPPPPSAKIALETPEPQAVAVTRPSVIETIVADKSVVKEGDVVVKLVGDRPIEAEVAALLRDQKRQQDLIDAATKRLDAAKASGNKTAETQAQNEINDRQKVRDTKQHQLAAKTAELDTFLIHAPVAGAFAPAVKQGAKVAKDAVVARIAREPIPVATFKVGNTRPYAANGGVEVAIRKGEQRVTCTVTEVQADAVKVTCPVDPELGEGTDVTLQVPAATAPSAPEPPAPAPPAGGSAAEAPAAPGAGSAEPPPAKP